MKYVTLNDGNKMPMIGYGVFQLSKDQTAELVFQALKAGYRLIDTAEAYFNEEQVGQGIKRAEQELGIKRSDVFLTTKVWITDFGYDQTRQAVEKSLQKLGTDYLDLVLLHDDLNDVYGSYRALEDLQAEGKIHSIGISNFSALRMLDIAHFNKVVPAVNQVETHLYYQQDEMHQWMKKIGVQHEAWGPLAEIRVKDIIKEPIVNEIAKKHGKTPGQIALKQILQRGIVIIPKTTKPARMKENLDLFDFELDEDDMKKLQTLDEGHSLWTGYDDPNHLAEVTEDMS
ncbi:MAG: aldo/keto reductase [Lactobacillus sp.]|jgi:2,5-diketo-D-gluconate reductase A|nr:aldo/keto reductase [Lactobacillus sp.]MCH3906371.1 aldo/keto reductase [Lactobacillus sp.]MCH3990055.1 aldo/keto reductase [Lactobacillus sp.]MCH4069231.1 aldo/keto reductase [Lactobacillus sp.]MCI1303533.1 aldo/keto reductase [Lactobacillus sp.]